MKKAVLKPCDKFCISDRNQKFINAMQICLEVLPDACFYYELWFGYIPGHEPMFIVTSNTDDVSLFVKTIEEFTGSSGFKILPKAKPNGFSGVWIYLNSSKNH